jgi:hypothetical protein
MKSPKKRTQTPVSANSRIWRVLGVSGANVSKASAVKANTQSTSMKS